MVLALGAKVCAFVREKTTGMGASKNVLELGSFGVTITHRE